MSALVITSLLLFAGQWAAAPRVDAGPQVEGQLSTVRGRLYLGETFEGLPLRRVRPDFLYSDCVPGRAHVVPCTRVAVRGGRVTGSDPRQVHRAATKLRPVP